MVISINLLYIKIDIILFRSNLKTHEEKKDDVKMDPNADIMKEAYEHYKETGDLYTYTLVHQACDGGGYAGSAGSETGASVLSSAIDLVAESVSYLTSNNK